MWEPVPDPQTALTVSREWKRSLRQRGLGRLEVGVASAPSETALKSMLEAFTADAAETRGQRTGVARQVLTWKLEDGPEDAGDGPSPHDVGPAWLDTYDGTVLVDSEPLADGDWISRADARRLAEDAGYDFAEDG